MASLLEIEATLRSQGQQIASLMNAMTTLSVSVQRLSSTQQLVVNSVNQTYEPSRGGGFDSTSPTEQHGDILRRPQGDGLQMKQEFDKLRQEIFDLKWQVRTLDSKLHSGSSGVEAVTTYRDRELLFDMPRDAPTEDQSLIEATRGLDSPSLQKRVSVSQLDWSTQWLAQVDNGELDIYTCLALSNCFSWTPDTRKIFARAVGVTFLQMVVPWCLLIAEINLGIEFGPAENAIGFRVTGAVLYGYAIYSMFNGAQDKCRTDLLNLCFHHRHVPCGHWLPLVAGEISNVFTAVVLMVALYSIFTTQTNPADLILNAVAVNFLGDVDASFVDKEMRKDAVETFKSFTTKLFLKNESEVDDPNNQTCIAKTVLRSLQLLVLLGGMLSINFLVQPVHTSGMIDTMPGLERSTMPQEK